MVAIRVDANSKIGMGHLMRCLAIAKELVYQGEKVTIITADEYPSKIIEQWGFNHAVLKTNWANMEDEIKEIITFIKYLQADILLVDSYYVSAKYFKYMKKYITTAYIDDFAKEVYPVDILINYNISYCMFPYEKMYKDTNTKLLLGTKYVPLREEFSKYKLPPINKKIENIIITTGGTDPFEMSNKLVENIICNNFKDIFIHVIAGKFYKNTVKLKKMSQQNNKIIIHENVKAMSEIMNICDVAISASGTTLYELCACGVPAVIFSFADNQTQIRECFGKSRTMIDCGDYRNQKDNCIDKIISGLRTLDNQNKRKELRKKEIAIADGHGANKIASFLSSK